VHAMVAPVQENQRDIGLVRAVGSWAFAASIVSMIVGAGIFAVPAALAACVGPYAPLAFLACGVAVGAVAMCFAEGGSRVPTSGGVYGVIEAAFGPLAGYVSGTLLWVCCVLACGAVAAALADVVASLFPLSFVGSVRAAVIVGVIGAIAIVNIGGVDPLRGNSLLRHSCHRTSAHGDLRRAGCALDAGHRRTVHRRLYSFMGGCSPRRCAVRNTLELPLPRGCHRHRHQ